MSFKSVKNVKDIRRKRFKSKSKATKVRKVVPKTKAKKAVNKKTKPASVRQRKIDKVMGEFKRGTLKSSSGKKVTNKKQAVAIALSKARKR